MTTDVRPLHVALLTSLLVVSCGKQGPPLPPIVRIPAPVEQIETRRVGAGVYVSFALPARNVDDSAPADLSRAELYAVTSRTPPSRDRFLEQATRIGAVAVALPPDAAAGEVPAQGDQVTLRDELTGAALVPRATAGPGPDDAGSEGPLRRFYAVAAYSDRGLSSGPGRIAELPLAPAPDPPSEVTATYDPERVRLSWAPAPGAADVPDPGPDAVPDDAALARPTGPARYNVYRLPEPDPAAAPAPVDAPPVPLNPEPLDAPAFSEPVRLDGLERCYVVRTVRGITAPPVEGEASPPACVIPVDVFPPAAPHGLSAVAIEGAISLIWAPNVESDLAGYLVLRGEPGDATLAPLTREPVRATQFVDRTVVPGRRYTYAVVAVDDQQPSPNVSAESNRVEETAR